MSNLATSNPVESNPKTPKIATSNLTTSKRSTPSGTTASPMTKRLSQCASILIAVVATLAFITPEANAETYYKWQDDSGVWHYGAIPPHGVEAIAIKTTGAGPTRQPVAANNETAQEPKNGSDNSSTEFFAETKTQVSKKESARLCKAAKANLETLNSSAVIRKRDADGNVTVVTEEERQAEIDSAKQTIKDYC